MSTEMLLGVAIGFTIGGVASSLKSDSVTRKVGLKNEQKRNQSICSKEFEVVLTTQEREQQSAFEALKRCQAKNAVNWY